MLFIAIILAIVLWRTDNRDLLVWWLFAEVAWFFFWFLFLQEDA